MRYDINDDPRIQAAYDESNCVEKGGQQHRNRMYAVHHARSVDEFWNIVKRRDQETEQELC